MVKNYLPKVIGGDEEFLALLTAIETNTGALETLLQDIKDRQDSPVVSISEFHDTYQTITNNGLLWNLSPVVPANEVVIVTDVKTVFQVGATAGTAKIEVYRTTGLSPVYIPAANWKYATHLFEHTKGTPADNVSGDWNESSGWNWVGATPTEYLKYGGIMLLPGDRLQAFLTPAGAAGTRTFELSFWASGHRLTALKLPAMAL